MQTLELEVERLRAEVDVLGRQNASLAASVATHTATAQQVCWGRGGGQKEGWSWCDEGVMMCAWLAVLFGCFNRLACCAMCHVAKP